MKGLKKDEESNSDSSDDEQGETTSFFFGGGDDNESDGSDDETKDQDERSKKRKLEEAGDAGTATSTVAKDTAASGLPSVSSLFSAAATPSFLNTNSGGKYEPVETTAFDNRKAPTEHKPWLKKSQTVETKAQRAKRAEQQPVPTNAFVADLQAAAAMNSNAYKDEEPDGFRERSAPTPIAQLNKVQKDKGSDKSKSWSVKEKRKRELGMTSREKSVVEEEKRILRENAGKNGYGFD